MLTGKPPWSPRGVAGDVLIVLSSVPFGNLSSSQPTSPDFGHSPPGSVGLNRLSAAQRRSYLIPCQAQSRLNCEISPLHSRSGSERKRLFSSVIILGHQSG